VLLNLKNRTGYEYLSATQHAADGSKALIPRLNNYVFSALAGTTWYLQFFFYTMGASQMGQYDFASWTLHMASIMIFGTLWGIYFREWQGSTRRARRLMALGLVLLISSTIVIGYGTWKQNQSVSQTQPVT
jgi:L-rhamnose-H+ transport protein